MINEICLESRIESKDGAKLWNKFIVARIGDFRHKCPNMFSTEILYQESNILKVEGESQQSCE